MKLMTSCMGVLALTVAAAAGPAVAADHVVLYSANDDTVNKLVADGFKKETGMTVNVVSTGSGVLFRRIASEAGQSAGRCRVGCQLRPAEAERQILPAVCGEGP